LGERLGTYQEPSARWVGEEVGGAFSIGSAGGLGGAGFVEGPEGEAGGIGVRGEVGVLGEAAVLSLEVEERLSGYLELSGRGAGPLQAEKLFGVLIGGGRLGGKEVGERGAERWFDQISANLLWKSSGRLKGGGGGCRLKPCGLLFSWDC
jgi:hypothetical protein